MTGSKTIQEMTVSEREDLLAVVAEALEECARHAADDGDGRFEANSLSTALTIRGSAYELAHDNLEAADFILQQAISLIAQHRSRRTGRNTILH